MSVHTATAAHVSRRPTRGRAKRLIPSVLLLPIACSTIYPIVFVVFTALKTNSDYQTNVLGPPRHVTLSFIRQAWNSGQIARTSLNSLEVVVPAIVLIVITSSLAGWALASMRFRGRRLMLLGVIGMMLLPPAVLMVPIFSVVHDLGLLNEKPGLSLVYASLHAPFATYLMTSYMQSIPRELEEAARVDGAGPWRFFLRVALPLSRPAVLTVVTLTFLWLWNEFLFGLILLQDEPRRILMVSLSALQGEFSTGPSLLAAGMLLAMLPTLAVFVIFQRNLASGLTAGAVK